MSTLSFWMLVTDLFFSFFSLVCVYQRLTYFNGLFNYQFLLIFLVFLINVFKVIWIRLCLRPTGFTILYPCSFMNSKPGDKYPSKSILIKLVTAGLFLACSAVVQSHYFLSLAAWRHECTKEIVDKFALEKWLRAQMDSLPTPSPPRQVYFKSEVA